MRLDFPMVYAQVRTTSADESYSKVTIPAGSYTYFPSESGVESVSPFIKTYTISVLSGGSIDVTLEYCNDPDYDPTNPSAYDWFKYYPRDSASVSVDVGESITWSFREKLWYTRLRIENPGTTDVEVVLSRWFG